MRVEHSNNGEALPFDTSWSIPGFFQLTFEPQTGWKKQDKFYNRRIGSLRNHFRRKRVVVSMQGNIARIRPQYQLVRAN